MFLECKGLLPCGLLASETTIDSEKYCETLEKLLEAVEPKRPE
jgi:hypothetical protein